MNLRGIFQGCAVSLDLDSHALPTAPSSFPCTFHPLLTVTPLVPGPPAARTPTASPHRFPRARVRSSHSNHDKTPSRHTSSRQGGSPDTWAAGSFRVFRGEVSAERSGTKAGGSPIHPATRENMAGSRRARLTAESRRRVRVTEIVDERTLRCLHPWIVTLLARSAVQFVPSVPHKHR